MGRPIFFSLLLFACHRPSPRATGAVMLGQEMLNGSTSVAQIVTVVENQIQLLLMAGATTVNRRGASMILDVTVSDPDARRAQERCNQLLRSYIERRLSEKLTVLLTKIQVLSEANQPEKVKELELERRMMQNDVQLVEPCQIRPATP